MIFKSFLLVNLVSVCLKIINSVVMVGLYYGFISAFATGSFYLFLLRPRFWEQDQDAIAKKVAENAGFCTGQLLIFISILYRPLHLALSKPYGLLLPVAPYFCLQFFCNNTGQYPDPFFYPYAYESWESIRILRIQWVFLNNLLFQLATLNLLASPKLIRLGDIYLFQCKNKMLFGLSSLVGWLIGHILIKKSVRLVFVWILKFIRSKRLKSIIANTSAVLMRNSFVEAFVRDIFVINIKRIYSVLVRINNSKFFNDTMWWIKGTTLVIDLKIRSRFYHRLAFHGFENVYMRKRFIEDMHDLFSMVFLILFLLCLDRTPLLFPDPIAKRDKLRIQFNREGEDLEEAREGEGGGEDEEGEDVEGEDVEGEDVEGEDVEGKDVEERGDPKLAKKDLVSFTKPIATPFFDPLKSLRPFRYIKTPGKVERAVRNETSQYFFYTCRSDGKERISFTYPPSLPTFWEMIQRKMDSAFPRISKKWRARGWFDPGSYTQWTYINEQKKNSLSREFQNRIQTLYKKRSLLNVLARRKRPSLPNVLEKRTRLCNDPSKKDTTKTEYLPEIYDPFWAGAQRGKVRFNEAKWAKLKSLRFFRVAQLNRQYNEANELKIKDDEDEDEGSRKKQNKISPKMIRSSINELHGLLIPETDYKKVKKKIHIVNTSFLQKKKKLFSFSLFKRKGDEIHVARAKKFLRLLLNPILPDPKIIRKNKSIELREITKKVPRWSYRLINDLERKPRDPDGNSQFGTADLRVLQFRRVAKYQTEVTEEERDKKSLIEKEEISFLEYALALFFLRRPDHRRGILKGTPRQDRRKATISFIYQVNPRSPLFTCRYRTFFEFWFRFAMKIKKNLSLRKKEADGLWSEERLNEIGFCSSTTTTTEVWETGEDKPESVEKNQKDEDAERQMQIEAALDVWEEIELGLYIRAAALFLQVFLRQKVVFPSFIIVKSIVRRLLKEPSDWEIDFARLNREHYAICDYNGALIAKTLDEKYLPKNWQAEGFQIRVYNPFSLKPWYPPGYTPPPRDMPEEDEDYPPISRSDRGVRFLTVSGHLTDAPYGSPIYPNFEVFFNPVEKEFKKKFSEWQKKHSKILNTRFINFVKKTRQWVIQSIGFITRFITRFLTILFSKAESVVLSVVRQSSESTLSQKEDTDNLKNERMSNQRISKSLLQGPVRALKEDTDNLKNERMSNQRISKSLLQGPVRALKDDSLPEEKVSDLDNKLREIWDCIDKVTNERKKIGLTPEPDSPNKLVQAKKKILKKLKRIKARLIRHKYFFLRIKKSYYVLLFFIKRISPNINIKRICVNLVCCAISIRKIRPLISFENSKKMSEKSICKNETNKEKGYKKNIYKPKKKKKKHPLISIFKESLYDIRISENDIKLGNLGARKKWSKSRLDLADVSQAYVFYKLYQNQLIKFDKLRYVFKYQGTSLFLKKEIKDYFEAQEIFHSKLKQKKSLNSGKNRWKNWLKAHYQYGVPPIIWGSLSHQKWRTKVKQQRMDENTDLNKRYSNEKRKEFFEENSLDLDDEENGFGFGTYPGQKGGDIKNSIKSYSYDLFSYQSINSEDKYVSPLCINNKQKSSDNYNRRKGNLFDSTGGSALSKNFLVQNDLLDLSTCPDRKYFHWRLLPVGLIGLKQKAETAKKWDAPNTKDTANNWKAAAKKWDAPNTENTAKTWKATVQKWAAKTVRESIKDWSMANTGDTVKYWAAANNSTSIKPGFLVNWQNFERTKIHDVLFDWMGMNTEIPNNCISDLKGWFFPELIHEDYQYQFKPWIIPTNLLFVKQQVGNPKRLPDLEEDRTEKEEPRNYRTPPIRNRFRRKRLRIRIRRRRRRPSKTTDGLPTPPPRVRRLTRRDAPFLGYIRTKEARFSQIRTPADSEVLAIARKRRLRAFVRDAWYLMKLPKKGMQIRMLRRFIRRECLKPEFIGVDRSARSVVTGGVAEVDLIRASRQHFKDVRFLMYQMIKIPLVEKMDPYTETRHKSNSDLFVPETILSNKRRRELRILISFYSRNGNIIHKNPVFCKYVKNCGEVVDKSEKRKKNLIKSFLWPNYRLEDLACMNRYWFNTNNGSRFSMLRIHMYPRLKIR